MPDWVGTILAALMGGGIAAIGTWWLNWKRAKPEIARIYEEMATKQAEQIVGMWGRLNNQDKNIQDQNEKIDQQYEKIEQQDEKIEQQDLKIQNQDRLIRILRKCLREWEKGIRMLVEQITENGMTPVWTPKALDDEVMESNEEEK